MTTDRTDLAFGGACNYLAVAFKPQAAGSGSLHLKLFHGQETTSFLQFSPPIRRNETRIKIHTGGWRGEGERGGGGVCFLVGSCYYRSNDYYDDEDEGLIGLDWTGSAWIIIIKVFTKAVK